LHFVVTLSNAYGIPLQDPLLDKILHAVLRADLVSLAEHYEKRARPTTEVSMGI